MKQNPGGGAVDGVWYLNRGTPVTPPIIRTANCPHGCARRPSTAFMALTAANGQRSTAASERPVQPAGNSQPSTRRL